MGNKSLPRASRSWTSALIEPLERRQMLNAAVLRDRRLTVYATKYGASVSIENGDEMRNIVVDIAGPTYDFRRSFRKSEVLRIRVFAQGVQAFVYISDLPHVGDVAVYSSFAADVSSAHPYDRAVLTVDKTRSSRLSR